MVSFLAVIFDRVRDLRYSFSRDELPNFIFVIELSLTK